MADEAPKGTTEVTVDGARFIRKDIADARVTDLVQALKLAHNCATLRDDGTCDGCVVSYALARAAGEGGEGNG